MSLFQQYQIELSKAKKELIDVKIEIGTYLTQIATYANPFAGDDFEQIPTNEIKICCKNLENSKEKAIELSKKIKNIEKELA